MRADQSVLILRPGGGGNRGSKLLALRFDSPFGNTGSGGGGSSAISFSSSSDLRSHGGAPPTSSFKTGDLRFEGHERILYTRGQLLQLREAIDVPEDIMKIKQEIEAELFGEDQNRGRGDTNLQPQSQTRYSEPDNRDWRGRSAKWPSTGEERNQEANQSNRQDQLNSQFARAQISSNQGT